jgi:hypothetical protein
MTKRFVLAASLAAAVVAACTARSEGGQGDSLANFRMTVAPLALEPPPVYALIGYRDRLELSSQQVTTLDSLATAVREANGILVDSLEEKAITSNRSPGVLQVNPSERPLLDQIRANNRGVIDRVAELLTPDQEEAVCELYEEDLRDLREEQVRRQRSNPNDMFSNRPRETRADSALFVRGFSVWPWCQATNAARDSLRNR